MIFFTTIIKLLLKILLFVIIIIFIKKNKGASSNNVKVFYGGGFPGNRGGPRVKISRLIKYFKNYNYNFNILYLLSNAQYLSYSSLNTIKKNNIPIVLNQNGVFYSGWYKKKWKQMNKNMALPYHKADYVFWQSDFCKRSADKFLGKREGKGEVLYNAVDTSIFYPQKTKTDKSILKLLVTGKMDGDNFYRIINIIKAGQILKKQNIKFVINFAGRIDQKNLLKSSVLITELKLEKYINFLGPYTQEKAPEIYRNSDIYLIMNYLDPCPNTVIEAMSCGLPVVYSASGGLLELVGYKAGVGILVKENWESIGISPEPKEITDSIIFVMDRLYDMSLAARKRAVEKFNIDKWIQRHKTIFQTLLERK